jgi:hypothetical protein
MNDTALRTYLNDHLAGATLGCDHAQQLAQMYAGTASAQELARIAADVRQDKATLLRLMDGVGARPSAVKRAGAWVAEKAGRLKFRGVTSGRPALGRYLALEAMSLGVEGKRSLWTALQQSADGAAAVQQLDLKELIARAEEQRETLERRRLEAAGAAFT